MQLINFKRPTIANYDSLTSLMDNDDEMEPSFYATFVKPGLHDYVVRFTHSDLERDYELDAAKAAITMPTVLGKKTMAKGLSQNLTNAIFRKKKMWD